jgi:hypothetical protein
MVVDRSHRRIRETARACPVNQSQSEGSRLGRLRWATLALHSRTCAPLGWRDGVVPQMQAFVTDAVPALGALDGQAHVGALLTLGAGRALLHATGQSLPALGAGRQFTTTQLEKIPISTVDLDRLASLAGW